jgi:predicted transposase/invertase (TIGR01784 family)
MKKDARAEALAEGHAEGKAIGLAEGRAEEKLKIAKNALANGISVEMVQKITGLDVESLKKIQV